MLLDHITVTSVDLTSRLTVYKRTPCNKTTVNLLLFISNNLRLGRTMSCTDGYFEAGLYESLRKICSTAIQSSTALAVL